jgi:hypothetical protein
MCRVRGNFSNRFQRRQFNLLKSCAKVIQVNHAFLVEKNAFAPRRRGFRSRSQAFGDGSEGFGSRCEGFGDGSRTLGNRCEGFGNGSETFGNA